MPHQCAIDSKEVKNSSIPMLNSKWLSLVVISTENPLCSLYFRSETRIRAEKIKQLCSKHPYIIHPMSKFRKWYDICMLFIYLMMLIVKPIDSSIGRRQSISDLFPYYREFSLTLDVISWTDITLHFGMGYIDTRNKLIEMRPNRIARNYICSHFITDVLSSIPRYLVYHFRIRDHEDRNNETLIRMMIGFLNIFCFMKIFRLFTIINLISEISYGLRIKSRTAVFLASAMTACLYILHMSSCLILSVPRIVRHHFGSASKKWKYQNFGMDYKDVYFVAVFKSSACLLGIHFDLRRNENAEDYVITVLTYIIGKFLIAVTWMLAVAILNNRSMDIEYQEIINQLNEYMRQKQLPLELRHRILQLYAFKYQERYFREELINSLLSDKLRRDINLHVCRSLIKNVSLFAGLPSNELSDVISLLVPEIFLPGDVIIQSSTCGDSMYFVSSGTVAVYTHSGKEICHLHDGAYFGEIALVLKGQARTATVIAVEVTQAFRLKKKHFDRTLVKNRYVYESIIHRAETRLKETLEFEEGYKMEQFEKTYAIPSDPTCSRSLSYVPKGSSFNINQDD